MGGAVIRECGAASGGGALLNECGGASGGPCFVNAALPRKGRAS